ncbi:hypothetical protein GCM10011607_29010 [Shewanella inventionis]|uniref:Uncharacterized protein n=1 Tax=Shewanella inventionis TaxID=1738770 RepID=A0ABQ1JHN5_9GAMM|nr:hypothetical protein [Shewanella inventionis]GGB66576.1 hypothetical protein GCM10011607_29010 [Shewanella inventionis]
MASINLNTLTSFTVQKANVYRKQYAEFEQNFEAFCHQLAESNYQRRNPIINHYFEAKLSEAGSFEKAFRLSEKDFKDMPDAATEAIIKETGVDKVDSKLRFAIWLYETKLFQSHGVTLLDLKIEYYGESSYKFEAKHPEIGEIEFECYTNKKNEVKQITLKADSDKYSIINNHCSVSLPIKIGDLVNPVPPHIGIVILDEHKRPIDTFDDLMANHGYYPQLEELLFGVTLLESLSQGETLSRNDKTRAKALISRNSTLGIDAITALIQSSDVLSQPELLNKALDSYFVNINQEFHQALLRSVCDSITEQYKNAINTDISGLILLNTVEPVLHAYFRKNNLFEPIEMTDFFQLQLLLTTTKEKRDELKSCQILCENIDLTLSESTVQTSIIEITSSSTSTDEKGNDHTVNPFNSL